MNKFILTAEQEAVKQAALSKQPLICFGRAGTGKSVTIKEIFQEAQDQGIKVGVAAPTGIVADKLTGDGAQAITIHSMFKFTISLDELVTKTANKNLSAMTAFELLLIDEASMLTPGIVDAMVAAAPKCTFCLFGDFGQLPAIAGKDDKIHANRYQGRNTLFDSDWWNKVAKNGTIELFELTKIQRTKDEEFIKALGELRNGNYPKLFRSREITLQQSEGMEDSVFLFNSNQEVGIVNKARMEDQQGRAVYLSEKPIWLGFNKGDIEDTVDDVPFFGKMYIQRENPPRALPNETEVKIGLKVMVLKNLWRDKHKDGSDDHLPTKIVSTFSPAGDDGDGDNSVKEKVLAAANGSVGTLISYNEHTMEAVVKMADGRIETIPPMLRIGDDYKLWKQRYNDLHSKVEKMKKTAEITDEKMRAIFNKMQDEDTVLDESNPLMPLVNLQGDELFEALKQLLDVSFVNGLQAMTRPSIRLAYALTVHKAQGLTIDSPVIVGLRFWHDGLGYVACSRVRSLDNLFIIKEYAPKEGKRIKKSDLQQKAEQVLDTVAKVEKQANFDF